MNATTSRRPVELPSLVVCLLAAVDLLAVLNLGRVLLELAR